MSCNIYIPEPIFTICRLNGISKKYYVFVGEVSKQMQTILEKLEKRKNIDKESTQLLKLEYKDYYLNWVKLLKEREFIKFIYFKIRLDDNLQEIKQKIFIHLSDPDKSDWILPNNQELWIVQDNKESLIGYKYENCNSPHITDKDLNSVVIGNKILSTYDNYKCLYDIINSKNITEYTIYIFDVNDEIKLLKKKGGNISAKYLKYYWPLYNINIDKNEIKKKYSVIKYYLENDNNIYKFIDSSKNFNHNNVTFSSINIILIELSINNNSFLESLNINLYNIFDYLKDNLVSANTPLIKYKDNQIDSPFIIISKDAIDNKIIDKPTIMKWIIGKVSTDDTVIFKINIFPKCKS